MPKAGSVIRRGWGVKEGRVGEVRGFEDPRGKGVGVPENPPTRLGEEGLIRPFEVTEPETTFLLRGAKLVLTPPMRFLTIFLAAPKEIFRELMKVRDDVLG